MRDLACDYVHVLTTLLLSQHTAFALHWLPVPTPMTVIGEQSRPTRTFRSWRMMPNRPRMMPTPAEFAYVAHANISVKHRNE